MCIYIIYNIPNYIKTLHECQHHTAVMDIALNLEISHKKVLLKYLSYYLTQGFDALQQVFLPMIICLSNCYAQCYYVLKTVWQCIFSYLMTGLCAFNCSSSSILSNGKYRDQVGKVNWKIHTESNTTTSLFNWQLFKAEHIPNIYFKTRNSQGISSFQNDTTTIFNLSIHVCLLYSI